MNWRIKGIIQKSLAALPGGVALNDVLQRTVGGLRNFEQNIATKVNADWAVLVGHMTRLGVMPAGLTYVEIGTGWYPTLPICFHLAGAGQIISYDLDRHLNNGLTRRMIRALESHLPAIATASRCDLKEVQSRFQHIWRASVHASRDRTAPGNAVTARDDARPPSLLLGFLDYRAPADAAATGLPDNSVDVVFSNSVLEHVPREAIGRLMKESERILRPGGLSMHSVNCGDHYAYFDKNVSFINYLTYTEAQWRFWNNALQYQNRLRPEDFVKLAETAGLKIAFETHKPRSNLLALLPQLTVANEFQDYRADQLCATSVDFVARKE